MSDAAYPMPRGQSSNRAGTQAGWMKMTVLVFVFAFVSSAAGLCRVQGQETLSWKFREGDVLKYTTEQTTMLNFKAMGKERKQKRAQSVTYTWSIKGVTPEGVADITQRIERVTMKIEAPPYMPFEYDSNTPASDIPEPFEGEVQQLKAVLGAEFSFKMRPSGEIESVKFPEATLKKLREGLPQEGGERDQFSEQQLKEFVTQQSPPAFPEGPLEPGKSWASKPNRIGLPLGTIVLDRSFTFQGPDPKNPNLMLITMEGQREPRARVQCRSQDPGSGRKGNADLRQTGRALGQQSRYSEDRDGHCRPGPRGRPDDRDDLGHDPRPLRPSNHPMLLHLAEERAPWHAEEPSGDAFVAAGLVECIDEPLSLVGDELSIPDFAG